MKISQILFGIILFITNCNSVSVDDVIEKCLLKILKNYFPNEPILLITDLTLHSTNNNKSLAPNLEKKYHRQIVKLIMSKKKWTLQVYNSDKYIGLPASLKLDKVKNSFVFIRRKIMSSRVLFEWEMDRLYKNPLWNPVGRTVVVVKGTKGEDLARRVIEKLWTKSKSVNNVVMVADDEGTVNFYTWFPYRQPDCSEVQTITLLDTYRRGKFVQKVDLFPEKITDDLENCELQAATETCIPYVFADDNNANNFTGGIEISMMKALSKVLNFTLTTIRPHDMWTTSVNNSLVGAFKLLGEQKIDLAFSCLALNQERYLVTSALPPYYSDSLVWFVPSPTFRTHMTDIFYAFSPFLWLMMITIMCLITVLITVFVYREGGSVSDGIVKVIGMSIFAPVGFPAKKATFRLFIFIIFIYSMHITIAFQSSLFALYQKPQYQRYYTSLREAVNDGLFVYLRSSSKELYNQSDHDIWKEIFQPGRFDYLKNFGEVFSEIAYDKTAIALFIKTTGIYMISVYFTDEYGVPQILWLRKPFAPYPVTSYMAPGHPLFPVFRKKIYDVLASGLLRIWSKRSVLGGKMTWERSRYQNTPLSLAHVEGAFFLLLLLLSFAVLVFFGEVVLHFVLKRYKEDRKPRHRHFPPVKPKFGYSTSIVRIG